MEISHPRRILILASPTTVLVPIINALVPPEPNSESLDSKKVNSDSSNREPRSTDASLNADGQPLHQIKTPYYSAQVPIWTDRIESSKDWCEEWKQQDGAGEVVRAIGAWIVAFSKPVNQEDEATQQFLNHVSEVITHHSGPSYEYSEDVSDAVRLAVALPASAASNHGFDFQQWDDTCQESGAWELIDAEASGAKNQYGESTGFKRLLEALQSAEWDAGEDLEEMLGLDGDDNERSDAGEPETEEMREPILVPEDRTGKDEKGTVQGSEEDVEELQRMMVRLQAARDMGSDLPIGERRKLAAKAVRDVMRG